MRKAANTTNTNITNEHCLREPEDHLSLMGWGALGTLTSYSMVSKQEL